MTVLRILVIKNPIILSVSLIFNIAFAQQTEIDGKLKVKGEVDVSGNRITNIGDAITAGDAINTQNLQDALWDEGPYETKTYLVDCAQGNRYNGLTYDGYEFGCMYKNYGDKNFTDNWDAALDALSQANWKIYHVVVINTNSDNWRTLWVMRKKIE